MGPFVAFHGYMLYRPDEVVVLVGSNNNPVLFLLVAGGSGKLSVN